MTGNDKKLEYLRSFIKTDSEIIDEIGSRNEVRKDVQPSVEPETGRFLELIIRLTGAKRVLELGTSNGYSALWMLKALSETGGSLVTIDSKERLHLEALKNFRIAGYENVTAVLGDAVAETAKLSPGFDLIFQDCGKYLYPILFERTCALLKPGGLIIADDSLFSVNPGVRTNLGRFTDEYNRMAFSCDGLLTSIIPIGHGLTVSFKL